MARMILACSLLTILVLACGPAAPSAAPPATPAPVVTPIATSGPAPEAPAAAASSVPTATGLAGIPSLSPPVTIRIGVQGTGTDGVFFIAQERGYFERLGLVADFQPFASSSDMIPPLATGQLEVGGLGFNPALYNAWLRGLPIKVVADKSASTPGHGSSAVVVRKDLYDSGVRDLAGLRGRTIANTPPPNATGLAISLSRGLGAAGLSEADVNVVPLPFSDMPAALAGGSIDAAMATEPFVAVTTRNGTAVRLIGSDEMYPNQETSPLGIGETLFRDRPEAARRFMAGYVQAARDWVNAFDYGVDRAAIVEIMTKHTALKDPAIWEAMVPPGLNPDGYSYYQSAIEDQDWYVAKGTLQQRVDVLSVVDNSFVDYAIGVLGPYAPPPGVPPRVGSR
jgi:NitT/TauT family transport system substrate-binding protein